MLAAQEGKWEQNSINAQIATTPSQAVFLAVAILKSLNAKIVRHATVGNAAQIDALIVVPRAGKLLEKCGRNSPSTLLNSMVSTIASKFEKAKVAALEATSLFTNAGEPYHGPVNPVGIISWDTVAPDHLAAGYKPSQFYLIVAEHVPLHDFSLIGCDDDDDGGYPPGTETIVKARMDENFELQDWDESKKVLTGLMGYDCDGGTMEMLRAHLDGTRNFRVRVLYDATKSSEQQEASLHRFSGKQYTAIPHPGKFRFPSLKAIAGGGALIILCFWLFSRPVSPSGPSFGTRPGSKRAATPTHRPRRSVGRPEGARNSNSSSIPTVARQPAPRAMIIGRWLWGDGTASTYEPNGWVYATNWSGQWSIEGNELTIVLYSAFGNGERLTFEIRQLTDNTLNLRRSGTNADQVGTRQ
ncbi:MAG: lipocalin family protein [Elusimicrobia bacterium]|nr:lipocalin family protein [Elusimicrobiota bacterium]